MADPQPMAPFSVPVLIATSLDALISAASLHLGDPAADGRTLADPDPQEAWRALVAAQGLISHVGAMLSEDTVAPFAAAHAHLVKRLADTYPNDEFPVPAAMVMHLAPSAPTPGAGGLPNLQAMAEAGAADLESAEPAPAPRPAATGPLKRPGAGLPTKGSSPLFPR